MPQILASKLSLFGLPIKSAMDKVKEAGFDGIEVLLTDRFRNYIWRCQHFAKELGLTLHFHQAWSADEDPTDWKFKILEGVGYIPKPGYALSVHMPETTNNHPVVINGDRINQARRSNFWYQTDCVFWDPWPKLPFPEFVRVVKKNNLSVVFDTQHYLEWRLGVFRDLSRLPKSQKGLFDLLKEGWELLGPHTKEIHLNDFNPTTGERNVFPSTGIAPLGAFCNLVQSGNWQGYIVPEVSPQILFPYSTKKLICLRETVESYFA